MHCQYFLLRCSLRVGETILEQLGILFAIGVAIGMAKKTMVQRAFSGDFRFFIVTVVLSPKKLAPYYK